MSDNCYECDSIIENRKKTMGCQKYPKKVNYRVYIFSCSVRSEEYRCKTKHAFVYDSHFNIFHQSECCGDHIDNKSDAHIFVLEDNNRETKLNLKHTLKTVLVDCALWNMSTK